jgi:hypothetical protein
MKMGYYAVTIVLGVGFSSLSLACFGGFWHGSETQVWGLIGFGVLCFATAHVLMGLVQAEERDEKQSTFEARLDRYRDQHQDFRIHAMAREIAELRGD